jgi:hypothetical protein
MGEILPRISYPEIFLGFVCPIGADIEATLKEFSAYFTDRSYEVVPIKVTDLFSLLSKYLRPEKDLVPHPLADRYDSYISYGNQLRRDIGPDSILAAATVMWVVKRDSELIQKISSLGGCTSSTNSNERKRSISYGASTVACSFKSLCILDGAHG